MLLRDLITRPNQIALDLRATDRWSAIDEMMVALANSARLSSEAASAVAAAVREREQSMTTGIGHGIGIPHAPTNYVERVEAVIGIARHDVDFEALDDEPVHIVLLFVVPKNQFQAHLDTLANIARVLSNADTRHKLLVAATPDDVLSVIASDPKEPEG